MPEQSAPFRINDTFFAELQEYWARRIGTKNPTSEIIVQIRRKLNIAQTIPLGQMVFYGRSKGSETNECLLGRLIAVATGIVILDAYDSDLFYPLSGLLERSDLSEAEHFRVRCFASRPISLGLWIRPSAFPKNQPRFTDCPVWIDIEDGAGHAEFYMALGIDPDRWELMRTWLDMCLPPGNNEGRA